MTFPKEPTRSPGWYDNCFEGASPELPADLRSFSESVCDRFTISGICDPMYIANVTAYELGRGDGCGQFHPAESFAGEQFSERVTRLVEHLTFAYSTCIRGAREELRTLALKCLTPARF